MIWQTMTLLCWKRFVMPWRFLRGLIRALHLWWAKGFWVGQSVMYFSNLLWVRFKMVYILGPGSAAYPRYRGTPKWPIFVRFWKFLNFRFSKSHSSALMSPSQNIFSTKILLLVRRLFYVFKLFKNVNKQLTNGDFCENQKIECLSTHFTEFFNFFYLKMILEKNAIFYTPQKIGTSHW